MAAQIATPRRVGRLELRMVHSTAFRMRTAQTLAHPANDLLVWHLQKDHRIQRKRLLAQKRIERNRLFQRARIAVHDKLHWPVLGAKVRIDNCIHNGVRNQLAIRDVWFGQESFRRLQIDRLTQNISRGDMRHSQALAQKDRLRSFAAYGWSHDDQSHGRFVLRPIVALRRASYSSYIHSRKPLSCLQDGPASNKKTNPKRERGKACALAHASGWYQPSQTCWRARSRTREINLPSDPDSYASPGGC